MLKIRLKRVGRKNDPSFRLVVVPSTEGPKTGNVLEVLGNYDPRRDSKELNAQRIQYWISKGAQVSDTVHNLLVGEKIIDGKKKNVLPKKSAPVKEEIKEEKIEVAEETAQVENEPEAALMEEKIEQPGAEEEKTSDTEENLSQ